MTSRYMHLRIIDKTLNLFGKRGNVVAATFFEGKLVIQAEVDIEILQ